MSFTLADPPPDLLPTKLLSLQGAGGADAAKRLESCLEQMRSLDVSLIVDMDDTLNTNNPLFLHSRRALLDVYMELDANNRCPIQMAELQQTISNEMIPALGYTPERWYQASLECARIIAGRDLTPVEESQVLDAAEVAMGVGELMPGVRETLTLLHEAGIKMMLLTKGERLKQEEKVAAHALDRYFDHIEIVDHKDTEVIRELVARHGLDNAVMIGNSKSSDITPALDAGLAAVHVDHGAVAWGHELDGHNHGYDIAPSFPEAVELLLR